VASWTDCFDAAHTLVAVEVGSASSDLGEAVPPPDRYTLAWIARSRLNDWGTPDGVDDTRINGVGPSATTTRLLGTLGSVLVLGGLGHFIGIIRFYLTHGVPDSNRVLLDVWIGEAQIIGGSLYVAAFRAVRSHSRWRSLGTFGAVTIIGYAVPILPVLVARAPVLFRVPAAVYLGLSLWILTRASKSATWE
jgi:hypothetical protein